MHPIAVVHLAVEPLDAAGDPAGVDEGIQAQAFLARQHAAARQAPAGRFRLLPHQPVREREVEAQERAVAGRPPAGGQHERHRPHEVRRDARQGPALPREAAQRGHVARLQRPDAAVYRLGAVERRAAAEVAAVDDGHRQSAQRGVPRRDGAVNAAAEHQQIERAGRQRRRVASHGRHDTVAGFAPLETTVATA